MTDKERENRERLFKLMKENPELPIVPLVDGEIVGDDCGAYWPGSWGRAEVKEYFISKNADKVFFKSDDVFNVLEEHLSNEEFEALPESEEECRPYYDNLPWIKAIIVYIGKLALFDK